VARCAAAAARKLSRAALTVRRAGARSARRGSNARQTASELRLSRGCENGETRQSQGVSTAPSAIKTVTEAQRRSSRSSPSRPWRLKRALPCPRLSPWRRLHRPCSVREKGAGNRRGDRREPSLGQRLFAQWKAGASALSEVLGDDVLPVLGQGGQETRHSRSRESWFSVHADASAAAPPDCIGQHEQI